MSSFQHAKWTLALAASFALAPNTSVAKSKWKSKGDLSLEGRAFSDDLDPRTEDFALGLAGRLQLDHKHKPFRERMRIFGRLDRQDPQRTILIVEELWAEYKVGKLYLRAGADLLNWTATEAFHPADIINARNLDSDLENYEKVGEPMVSLRYRFWSGAANLYFMPYYSQPILPSRASRLSFIPPGAEVGPVLRLDRNGRITDDDFGIQGAARITQSIGSADLGVHVVHHLDRSQPEVVFDPVTRLPSALFRAVTQLGGTYQHVFEGLIAKVETAYRMFSTPEEALPLVGLQEDRDHLQVAVGLEYGLLSEDSVETTLLVEAQSVFLVEEEVRKALQIFQRDLLIGCRVALNDTAGTELLLSGIVDLEDPEQVLLNASFSRRIWASWRIGAAGRFVFAPEPTGPAAGIALPRNSDYLRFFLTRYF